MPIGRWSEDGTTMQLDLLHEVTDNLFSNFTRNLASSPASDISPFFVVSSPSPDREEPMLSFWPISAFYNDQAEGTPSFQTGVQVGRRGIPIAAFHLFALNSEDTPMRKTVEGEPDQIMQGEYLNMIGSDLEKRCVHIFAEVVRQVDTNAISLGTIQRIFPTPETPELFVKSKALDSFMLGYVNGLHIFKYGVELDPLNPYKMIKN